MTETAKERFWRRWGVFNSGGYPFVIRDEFGARAIAREAGLSDDSVRQVLVFAASDEAAGMVLVDLSLLQALAEYLGDEGDEINEDAALALRELDAELEKIASHEKDQSDGR